MNNRQARLFAIGCTLVAAIVFLGLTLDSHRQFGKLTNAEDITPAVTAGKDVWHDNNCINCHTLFGEGAYYAPDLTKIADHRGDAYLTAYMKDPSRFYDEQIHGRLMPQPNLSDEEIANLIAFLEWVSNVDNQGWPPRPIRVVGGMQMASTDQQASGAGAAESATADTQGPAGRLAAGRDVFRNASPGCQSCHSLQPGADMAGPTLAGIATRAAETIDSPDYTGSSDSVEGYIRESILEPSAHNVPGAMYSADGRSFMPGTYADSLSDTQVDQLAAWLASFE